MASSQTLETKSPASESWIASNRTPILLILLGVVAISGFQFVSSLWKRQKEEAAWAALLTSDQPDKKEGLDVQEAVRGTSAEAWYFLAQASESLQKEDFEGARGWLGKLSALGDKELRRVGSPDAEGSTIAASIQAKIGQFEEWKSKNERLFQNPPPDARPVVRFITDAGEFALGLYPKEAEKTCENFVKLCKEGFYNETRLFEVFQGYSIRGGDPSTRSETPESWTNQGPGYEIDVEKNALFNFQWAVSMYRVPGQEKASGSQFVIALQNQLGQDAPVFAKVIEGQQLLKEVGESGAEFKDGKSIPKKLLTIREVRIEE